VRPVEVVSAAGLFVANIVFFPLDMGRLLRTVQRTIIGLFCHTRRTRKIPDKY